MKRRPRKLRGRPRTGLAPPVVIDGPDTVVAGEQVRYRVQPSGTRKVMSWAAGGGSVAQAPTRAIPTNCSWSLISRAP